MRLRGGSDFAKDQIKEVLDINNKLEQQVDELSASYDQLAQNYGVSSGFKITRTASYSCLTRRC
jgi:hypothetical protein